MLNDEDNIKLFKKSYEFVNKYCRKDSTDLPTEFSFRIIEIF